MQHALMPQRISDVAHGYMYEINEMGREGACETRSSRAATEG
jgi:hypothetical protein